MIILATSGVMDEVRPGDHVCCLYYEQTDHWRVAAGQIKQGLSRGHRVVFFTETDAPTATARLERLGLSTRTAVAERQLEVTPATEIYLPDGHFFPTRMLATVADTINQTRAEGWPGLRIVADMAWALGRDCEDAELVWYEAQANRAFAGGYAAAACLYDRQRFSEGLLNEIVSAHQGTLAAEGTATGLARLRAARTAAPPGLRLSGEVDLSNRAALAAVLDGLVADLENPAGPVTIDVTGLAFVDAAAAYLLLKATRRDSPTVTLVGCSPLLRRMLDVLDISPSPHLR